MARIPVGKFGFQTAEPVAQPRRMPESAFGIGDGLGAAASSLSQAAHSMMADEQRQRREQEAEAKAAAKEAQRVASITAQATAKNSLADLHDDLVTGLADGRYDKDKLTELQKERSKKVVEDAVAGVAPEHKELVRASLLDDIGRSQRDLRHAVDTRNKQDVAAGIGSYIENMQRYAQRGETQRQEAMQNVETFLQSTGPKAGMNPKQISDAVQGFKEGSTFTWLDRAISQNQGNGKALARIMQDIAGDKFPELDPNKRTFLESKIQRNQQHLMAKAEAAERRNLMNLDRMEKRLSWYVENGRDIPATELASFEKASKGTVYAGSVQMIAAEQKAVSEMMRLTPAQMDARIKELETSYGKTPSREQIVHLEKVKRFAANSIKQLSDSPLDYAVQRTGAVVQPLDLTQPGTWADNLAARSGVLLEQSQRTGAAPKGLFPQEAQALSSVLRSARPEQQREILGNLSKGFGDMRVFKATMQQIAPDNPVVANAGIFAARGLKSPADRQVSDLILRGNDLLRPDTKTDGKPSGGKMLPLPKEDAMQRDFNSYEGNAYAGKEEARNVTYQTAKAIYAAKASEEGDYSGDLNGKRWKEAIRLATGGIESHRGRRIVLPYGMDYGSFKDGLRSRAASLVRSGTIDKDVTMSDLQGMPLENAGDGRYFFRVGDGRLVGKDGRSIIVDFNEAAQ